MNKTPETDSRREFLRITAAGAVGLSTGILDSAGAIASPSAPAESSPLGSFEVLSRRSLPAPATSDLHLRFTAETGLQQEAKVWLFYEDRQGAALGQTTAAEEVNFLTVTRSDDADADLPLELPLVPRTLDLFPTAPEFLHMVEVTLPAAAAAGTTIDFRIERWTGPRQPIDRFQFWLIVDPDAAWDFVPIGFRRYRRFVRRGSDSRMPTPQLLQHTLMASLQVTGEYRSIKVSSHRTKAGVYWGEFHGMIFNQRPLDDYYEYAKKIARLDFCAPFWFSYNTCVEDVWQRVKDAAVRHAVPGRFVPLVGFECGTPPDDSHRCVLFRNPAQVPPIFCDSRPPAQEPFHQRRFHPDTIICRSLPQFYETIEHHGGIVTGHFHTLTYDREVLAEIFQKNLTRPKEEEERIYELMRQGKRFALAGTSDTHDSMPGNPYPEPHLSMPAGFTGVYAEALTCPALLDAVLERRTFATSGTRMFMSFRSNGEPLGAELPHRAPRKFEIEVDGTAQLTRVELLRDGRPIRTWRPGAERFAIVAEDGAKPDQAFSFYLVRATQQDGHQGWTSPIWFG